MASKDPPYWLVPAALALFIPIIAVLSGAPTVLSALIGASLLALIVVGGTWFLMQERHKLRIREIEAEARLRAEEREQLATAERILEREVGVQDLRREIEQSQE